MRAPFAYYGGKMGMADQIVSLMPAHRVYMEPFFGSGAVFFSKPPARFEIVNDIDDQIVNFFQVLRDHTDELETACRLTPHARTEFVNALEPSRDPVERARRFWVRVNQSFAKTARDNTGWSITTARSQSVPHGIQSRIGRFTDAAERLAFVSIECCDAIDLIRRLATDDTLIYADPPYLGSTRVGAGNDYGHDMSDEARHRELAQALNETPARVIVSGYHSNLYADLYDGWHVIERPVVGHSSNSRTTDRSGRLEVLWLNYEPDSGTLWEIRA